MYKLIIRKQAQQEAEAAALYYESVQEGLGLRFLDRLKERYDMLALHPQLFGLITDSFRAVKIDDFPYLLVFKIYKNKVVVYMVHNTHKKPAYK